jgi:hypothetical protein
MGTWGFLRHNKGTYLPYLWFLQYLPGTLSIGIFLVFDFFFLCSARYKVWFSGTYVGIIPFELEVEILRLWY